MHRAKMTHNRSFSVSYFFFNLPAIREMASRVFCNPIRYVLRHWSASEPFGTRHGRETKLSERGTRGITSCETTVIALCGFILLIGFQQSHNINRQSTRLLDVEISQLVETITNVWNL